MKVEKCPRCTRCDIDMVHNKDFPCYVCPSCGRVATENWRPLARREHRKGAGAVSNYYGYVSVDALMDFAHNHVNGMIDSNDIARFPKANVKDANEQQSLQQIFGIPIARLRELAEAEREGRVVVLPCKVGDTVFVDKRTTPYRYFHPHDRVGAFAKCTVIGASLTKSGIKIKMRANYPSRCGRYGFLKIGAGAFGKTVFFTQAEAERALAEKGDADEK